MSKYDEDNAKFQQWATYLIFVCIGFGIGIASGSSSEEKLRFEMYRTLPMGCQKILDAQQGMLNNLEEHEATSNKYDR